MKWVKTEELYITRYCYGNDCVLVNLDNGCITGHHVTGNISRVVSFDFMEEAKCWVELQNGHRAPRCCPCCGRTEVTDE